LRRTDRECNLRAQRPIRILRASVAEDWRSTTRCVRRSRSHRGDREGTSSDLAVSRAFGFRVKEQTNAEGSHEGGADLHTEIRDFSSIDLRLRERLESSHRNGVLQHGQSRHDPEAGRWRQVRLGR
jgi:hypothetical protein